MNGREKIRDRGGRYVRLPSPGLHGSHLDRGRCSVQGGMIGVRPGGPTSTTVAVANDEIYDKVREKLDEFHPGHEGHTEI